MRFRPIDGRPFGDLIMLDILFIAAGLAFFAVTLAYTHICERL